MARKKEFIKKSEARILIYLTNAEKSRRNGKDMSKKLEVDYIYIMKLLQGMYDKGWIGTHWYNGTTYFHLTAVTPIKMAEKKIAEPQVKLGRIV